MGYISVVESLRISSTTFMQCAAKAIEFAEIAQNKRSFKVTDFGTNRKLMYDFLLVINTNLPPIVTVSEI